MRVGVIGCGVVGKLLARGLIAAGHEVRVHDRNEERVSALAEEGALAPGSVGELVRSSAVVLTSLPTSRELEEVVEGEGGLLDAAPEGLVHVETSTVGPEAMRALGAREKARGVELVDAPLCAGPRDAADRQTITLFVGAKASTFARLRPLLDAISPHVIYCGPLGHGQAAKLINNLTMFGFLGVVGEALALGVRAGLPLEVLRRVSLLGSGQCRLVEEMMPQSVFAGRFEPGYRVRLAAKDWRLIHEFADAQGLPLAAACLMDPLFEELAERGWDERSIHAMACLFEERAGVVLRAGGARQAGVGQGNEGEASKESGRDDEEELQQ